jgi:predicted ester cyclase
MSAEENKTLVRRFMEARAKADLNAIEEMMAPDFISHGSRPGQQPGREGYKRQVAEFVTAFSDVRFVIEDQVAQGDRVVSRISGRGTYDRNEIMSVAPTGREVSSMSIFIHRVSGGMIAAEWGAGSGGSALLGLSLEQVWIARVRVEQELEVARSIQQASLPEEVPEPQGWRISPFYQPAREVGGDFYDFHLLPDGRLGLVVGDATGKGVPAALVMSTTLGMLQLAARTLSSPSPGKVLTQVNETLLERIPQNMFVTCFYAILEPESATLRYANAGHDPPYVHRSGDYAEELRARGMPLGLMAGMEYEEEEISLGGGENVLFYSDGLVEAHDPQGEMFGFPRLRALVAEHGEEGSLVDFLMEELYSFLGEGWEQEDDITLLTLQRSAP